MTLPEYLCSLWLADSAFTTLAGDRAYPIAPPAEPQPFSVPCLVFTIVGGEMFNTHDDVTMAPSADLKRTVVQLTAYARKLSEAKRLCAAAHDTLHAAQDANLRVNLESGPRESKEGDLYRVDRDVALWARLAV